MRCLHVSGRLTPNLTGRRAKAFVPVSESGIHRLRFDSASPLAFPRWMSGPVRTTPPTPSAGLNGLAEAWTNDNLFSGNQMIRVSWYMGRQSWFSDYDTPGLAQEKVDALLIRGFFVVSRAKVVTNYPAHRITKITRRTLKGK